MRISPRNQNYMRKYLGLKSCDTVFLRLKIAVKNMLGFYYSLKRPKEALVARVDYRNRAQEDKDLG